MITFSLAKLEEEGDKEGRVEALRVAEELDLMQGEMRAAGEPVMFPFRVYVP